jgi:hypothetical protein
VNDIVHGNRTLLQMTDLQVVGFGRDPFNQRATYFYSFATNNSRLTDISGYSKWNETIGSYTLLHAAPQIQIPFSVPGFVSGTMADFQQSGYDDFALSGANGTICILTASDPNDYGAGFQWGPCAQLDPLNDMAAGDFKGDGQREIAGLSVLSDGGLKLFIYTVDPKTLSITSASSLRLNTGASTPIPFTTCP